MKKYILICFLLVSQTGCSRFISWLETKNKTDLAAGEQKTAELVAMADKAMDCARDGGDCLKDPKMAALMELGRQSQLEACFKSYEKFFEYFKKVGERPAEFTNSFLKKACNAEHGTLDAVSKIQKQLLAKMMFANFIAATPGINAKVEKEYFDQAAKNIGDASFCSLTKDLIETYRKKKSMGALRHYVQCHAENCTAKTPKVCRELMDLAKSGFAKGDDRMGESLFHLYFSYQGLPKKEDLQKIADKIHQHGNLLYAELSRDFYTSEITPSIALDLMYRSLFEKSTPDQHLICAEAVLYSPWRRKSQGKDQAFEPKSISDEQWVKYTNEWATPKSGDYNPGLFKRFACTFIKNQDDRIALLGDASMDFYGASSTEPYDICEILHDGRFCPKETGK